MNTTRTAAEVLADPDATYQQRHAARLSEPCPMPRCRAGVGQQCTTPNGWLAYHKARENAVLGVTPALAKPRKHRLTDAQAQRIELAAQFGQLYAADQHAALGGDAAERVCADALERAGLVAQVGTGDDGCERIFELTAEGWRTYWHHRLVIRRLPDERHAETCPCEAEETNP